MIEYYGYLYNLTEFPFTADVWIELVYPDTTRINLRHWYDVTAEPGTNEWYVTQYVPYTVPLGIYQYWAYCGDYDNRIIDDSCFFPFMVVLGSENHQNADSWDVSRWGSGVEIENPISTISAVNYPNPFNAQTTISYDIFSEGDVRLDIYNIGGQKVANLKDDYSSAGYYNVSWDASVYSSGIYIYRLTIGEKIISGKMNLVK